MNIPNSFKEKIKSVFYDKTVETCEISTATDAEGHVSREVGDSISSFTCNVSYDRLDEVKEEYGIEEKIDIKISTQETISSETILKYEGEYFEIVKNIPYDAYNLILGRKWL